MSSTATPKVVPAQLSFLAIYSPKLGRSDETFHNQVVFYYSKAAKARSRINGSNTQAEQELREHENEKLRQVGLAQGMVGFARSFSNGAAVDSVETQKSRIVLHELEEGWWILASIDLTQLPAHNPPPADNGDSSGPAVEYSSREVSPPELLVQQLVRAHNVFRLHHGTTLEAMLQKHHRAKFCSILEKYWSRFASTWDVLLHGSPAVGIYNGLKLAAGGELGMGVGEEEWGSGERLVLEDFVQRTDGLLDFIVSRFGEPSPLQDPKASSNASKLADVADLEPWIGSGRTPNASDGIVFSGVGAITRRSLRDLSHWIETIYSNGDHAYGVRDNPTTVRRRRRPQRRNQQSESSAEPLAKAIRRSNRPDDSVPSTESASGPSPNIPPPIVKAVEASLDKASTAVDSSKDHDPEKSEPLLASLGDTETWMKYLTLGYGTAWGGAKKPASDEQPGGQDPAIGASPAEAPMRFVDPEPDIDHAAEKLKTQIQQENSGYFAIGLKGNMEEEDADDCNEEGDWNNRTLLRTVHVELTDEAVPSAPGTGEDEVPQFDNQLSFNSSSIAGLRRLRPVVYVHRPFIYTFLFHPRTESLTIASFYRDLHTYFSPLHRPLSISTSPSKVAARIADASNPYTTTASPKQFTTPNPQPIYDLVYDPRTLTVHSSIPNIPDPGALIASGLPSNALMADWTRLEALTVHAQILATVTSTRRSRAEVERTCKTGRGWWVVWMRLPPSQVEVDAADAREQARADADADATVEFDADQLREAFLVRRARDAGSKAGAKGSSGGSRFASTVWRPVGEKVGEGWEPKGLVEGSGFDARRYVEGLLSLNR